MDSRAGLWIVDGLLLFTLFVVIPLIAAAIGYAAWKGKPKRFDREMYWMSFIASGAVGGFLMVYAQRMQTDVRTWQYLLQLACFGFGALLFGVSVDCAVGIFTYRRSSLSGLRCQLNRSMQHHLIS
jgi:hypothetical protein